MAIGFGFEGHLEGGARVWCQRGFFRAGHAEVLGIGAGLRDLQACQLGGPGVFDGEGFGRSRFADFYGAETPLGRTVR